MVTGNIYVHLRKKTFKKIYSPKKTLVNTGEAPGDLTQRYQETSFTFTPPAPGFKGILFQQGMWGGRKPKK